MSSFNPFNSRLPRTDVPAVGRTIGERRDMGQLGNTTAPAKPSAPKAAVRDVFDRQGKPDISRFAPNGEFKVGRLHAGNPYQRAKHHHLEHGTAAKPDTPAYERPSDATLDKFLSRVIADNRLHSRASIQQARLATPKPAPKKA